MNVGRIDSALPLAGATPAARDEKGEAQFAAALGQGGPEPAPAEEEAAPPPFQPPAPPPGPPGALWPAELPVNSHRELPVQTPPWTPPHTINTVRDALEALLRIDRLTARRLLARFGGALDAGQLGYVLDTAPAVAEGVIALLDEVGDKRLGEEELEPGSVQAALDSLLDAGSNAGGPGA